MKNKILKVFIAFLLVMLIACTVCLMSSCSRDDNNNNVTITFVANGGKEIAPITLKNGEELTLPTAEKDGRVFADWYYDEGFTSVCPKKIIAKKGRNALCPVRCCFNFCNQRRNGNRAANLLRRRRNRKSSRIVQGRFFFRRLVL